jgi:hypothetical protein
MRGSPGFSSPRDMCCAPRGTRRCGGLRWLAQGSLLEQKAIQHSRNGLATRALVKDVTQPAVRSIAVTGWPDDSIGPVARLIARQHPRRPLGRGR